MLGLGVILVAFHRPLVFFAVRHFVTRLASGQNLRVDYRIGGSIFTTLNVTGLHATPTGPGPVERLEIGELKLRYSLTGLMRKGPGWLKDVDLSNVFVVLDSAKFAPSGATAESGNFPLLFPERIHISNVNFTMRAPGGDVELAGFYLSLDPEKPGALAIRRLSIPRVAKGSDIAARATFRDRSLVLNDLSLGPEMTLKWVNVDMSKLDGNEVALGLDGMLFGAATSLSLKVTDLNHSNHLDVHAVMASADLDAVQKYFDLITPVHGNIDRIALQFDGALEKPREWSGQIETRLERLSFDKQPFGEATVKVNVGSGRATVRMVAHPDAKNEIALSAEMRLPEKLADFKTSAAKGHLEIAAPDMATLTQDLPQIASGDLNARADFTFANGGLVADATLESAKFKSKDGELTETHFTIHAEKDLTADGPFFEKLITRIHGGMASARFGDYTSEIVAMAVASRGADVNLEKLSLAKGANRLNLSGTYTLPSDLKSWVAQPLAAELDLSAPELAAFIAEGTTTTLSGALMISGKVKARGGLYDGLFTVAGKYIELDGFPVRVMDGEVKMAGARAQLPKFTIVLDEQNHITATGDFGLAAPFDYDGQVEVDLPDLALFQPLLAKMNREEKIGGSLDLSFHGKGALQPKGAAPALPDGILTVSGRRIIFGGVTVHALDAGIEMTKGRGLIRKFSVVLDDKNQLSASGKFALVAPFDYEGSLNAKLGDLGAFQPLLRQFNHEEQIGGALAVEWHGQGMFQRPGEGARHSGDVRLDMEHGRFGNQSLAAHLVGNYSPEKIDVPELRVSSPEGELQLTLHHENAILNVQNIGLKQGRLAFLEGEIQIPLDLAQMGNPNLLIPDDGPVKIALHSKDLNLKTLFDQFAQVKPKKTAAKQKTAQLKDSSKKPEPTGLTGTVSTMIAAEGTVKNLVANISVRASKLQAGAAEMLAPADVALDLNLRENRLKVSGTVTQRDIKPLTVSGDLPLDVAALKKSAALDPNTPLDLRVSLPRSPLGFIKSLVPAIRFIDGTAAIDARAGGTIGKPELSGSAQADIPNLRMKDASRPPINNVIARIDFTSDSATIRQCKGGLGGGSFDATGSVKLEKITEPVFDLHVTTRDALVLQDDNVTTRATSDLRIAGPLNAATVTGKVSVTKGRFFKDIDILPIGLPGRPAPQPPSDPLPFGFPNPPLRDWKFDVAVKTQDPFLLQGNLANGRSVIDLKLGGTGAKPWLDGNVRIENLMTSLPFSRLEITSGFVNFTPNKPFVPQLDVRGESTIRDYKITVYIYGDGSNPQALFTSEPPLPQSEIVELIATGTTARELAGDSNALAGRAAMLVGQKYFRKIFKKGEPSQPRDTPFKNVQFDVGTPDPRSGSQSLQIRLPLSDKVVLSGGVDVGGDYRGQIKYLLRFR